MTVLENVKRCSITEHQNVQEWTVSGRVFMHAVQNTCPTIFNEEKATQNIFCQAFTAQKSPQNVYDGALTAERLRRNVHSGILATEDSVSEYSSKSIKQDYWISAAAFKRKISI